MAAAVALSAPAAAAPPAAPAAPYAAPSAPLAALMPEEADLPFEEEILRDPYSVKAWLRYLDARLDAPLQRRAVLLFKYQAFSRNVSQTLRTILKIKRVKRII